MSGMLEPFGKPLKSGGWQVWKRRLIIGGVLVAIVLAAVGGVALSIATLP